MRQSIQTKLITLFAGLLIISLIIVGGSTYLLSKDQLDDLGKLALKNSSLGVLDLIESANHEVESGAITIEEAQDKVREQVVGPKNADGSRTITNPIKYGENFYFYLIDEKGYLMAHPNLDGQSVYDEQNDDGTYFIRDVIEAGKQKDGGYVSYTWPTPNDPSKREEKLVYSIQDPHWGWIVVASTYKNDLYAGLKNTLYTVILVTLIVLILSSLVYSFYVSGLTKRLRAIKHKTNHMIENDLTTPNLKMSGNDEITRISGISIS